MDASGRFSLGTNLTWNGSTLSINGGGTFTGALSGGTISIGSGNNIFKADSNGIYLGDATFALAEFRVTPAGEMTATSGYIAGWTIGTNALYVGLNSTSGTSYINTSGGAWFSAGVLAPSFAGFGAPSTTGGATSQNTTTVIVDGVSQTRGYLRNISYGTNAQKPTSPVLGDIHFTT